MRPAWGSPGRVFQNVCIISAYLHSINLFSTLETALAHDSLLPTYTLRLRVIKGKHRASGDSCTPRFREWLITQRLFDRHPWGIFSCMSQRFAHAYFRNLFAWCYGRCTDLVCYHTCITYGQSATHVMTNYALQVWKSLVQFHPNWPHWIAALSPCRWGWCFANRIRMSCQHSQCVSSVSWHNSCQRVILHWSQLLPALNVKFEQKHVTLFNFVDCVLPARKASIVDKGSLFAFCGGCAVG